jgi:hypothetical protein
MFPLSDGIPARRFPIVNVLLIALHGVGPAESSPRRNWRGWTPVAEMRIGAGSGTVSLVINYQQ